MEENKTVRARQHQYATERYYNEPWYTVPCHVQQNSTRSIANEYACTRKRGLKGGQKRKETERKGKQRKQKKNKAKINMRQGERGRLHGNPSTRSNHFHCFGVFWLNLAYHSHCSGENRLNLACNFHWCGENWLNLAYHYCFGRKMAKSCLPFFIVLEKIG